MKYSGGYDRDARMACRSSAIAVFDMPHAVFCATSEFFYSFLGRNGKSIPFALKKNI